MANATTVQDYLDAKAIFDSIGSYSDSKVLSSQCNEKVEEARKNSIYNEALTKLNDSNIKAVKEAIEIFDSISDWRDSASKKAEAEKKVQNLENAFKKKKKRKRIIAACLAGAAVVVFLIVYFEIIPNYKYKMFLEACDNSNFEEMKSIIAELPSSKQKPANDKLFELGCSNILTPYNYGKDYFEIMTEDRESTINHEYYIAAEKTYNNGDRDLAKTLFKLSGPEGSEQVSSISYEEASEKFNAGEYMQAMHGFNALGDYKDSPQKYIDSERAVYNQAIEAINRKDYQGAESMLSRIRDYSDTAIGYDTIKYSQGLDSISSGKLEDAIAIFEKIENKTAFSDLNERIKSCSDGINYMNAYDKVRRITIWKKEEIQSATDKINTVLSMPKGAAPEDYTGALNTELQYIEWYGKYVGYWKFVSSQDPYGSVYADTLVYIQLQGTSSYCAVSDLNSKLKNGSTTTEDGKYVISGTTLKMLFNHYWSTFVPR